MKRVKLNLGLLAVSAFSVAGAAGYAEETNDKKCGKDRIEQVISLKQVGRTVSRGYGVHASEIVAYDKAKDRIFTINTNSNEVDVFKNLTAKQPILINRLNIAELVHAYDSSIAKEDVKEPNFVAVYGDYAAIAVEHKKITENGWVVFLNLSDLSVAKVVEVGASPDMLTFTPDGTKVLVANEGKPSDDYLTDPEGSISVITVADFKVQNIDFKDFNAGGSRYKELDSNKVILDGYSATNAGHKATVAQSFEPEYIAVAEDGSKAFVALQENNAIAVLDLSNYSIEKIFGLGFKDHNIIGNEIDASDRDGGPNLKNWPIMGIYMPDSIAAISFNGKTFLLTANEGNSRQDWLENITDKTKCETAGYWFDDADGLGKCSDKIRVKNLSKGGGLALGIRLLELDKADGNEDGVISDDRIGRLKVSYHTTRVMNGNSRKDGAERTYAVERVYAYGARSFSIWDTETGEQVFDSGSDFERITAMRYGEKFNLNYDSNSPENRSDDKGPEPGTLTVGKINGHTYAFIGLERMGGIMVYDVSNPYAPKYVQYINNRKLNVEPAGTADVYTHDAGDLGPEGLKFVPATDSPDGKNYLIVGNEVSGTTTVYEVKPQLLQAEYGILEGVAHVPHLR